MSEMMKCLSLHLPWALLCCTRRNKTDAHKGLETRDWSTSYRGTLLIHAAKKWNNTLLELTYREPFATAMGVRRWKDQAHFIVDLPFGRIVGAVELVGCYKIVRYGSRVMLQDCDMRERSVYDIQLPDAREQAFGDYSVGRFVWVFERPQLFDEPIEFSGHQKLFNVPRDLVLRQLSHDTRSGPYDRRTVERQGHEGQRPGVRSVPRWSRLGEKDR